MRRRTRRARSLMASGLSSSKARKLLILTMAFEIVVRSMAETSLQAKWTR